MERSGSFSPTTAMGARYERRQLLGSGAAGVVHAGVDLLLGRPVAIKTLHGLGGHGLYWLKREFRALAEFSHRNFAELYELVVDETHCFFTMELVEGATFFTRFRPRESAGVDYPALRDALVQLAAGLSALHAQQKLHRDIKPQNVLIDREDRVVILDYDLVLDTADNRPAPATLAGTPVYMPPEQLWGHQPTPASDWYAVGAMTFEVLTGEVPFAGTRRLHTMNGSWAAPRARDLAPETPPDLDELVARMLEATPAHRAGAAEVITTLAPARATRRAFIVPLPSSTGPAGRDAELALLQTAFADAGRARTVSIEGPAGIGKTTLVEHFLRGLETRPDVLVLRGRSHPREAVPFKAIDAAIDDLHRYVLHQPAARREALLDAGDDVIARLFPVFGDLYAAPEASEYPSPELRAHAFDAMRALLARVAEDVRVVLWLDDLHWSDRDSVALLRALRREPHPPRLFTILTFRDGEPGSEDVLAAARDAAWGLETDQESLAISLGPLSAGAARAVAAATLAGADDGTRDPHRARDAEVGAIVAAAAGNPLLLVELSRHAHAHALRGAAGPTRLEDVVAERLQGLPADAREVLQLVAVSSGPLPEEVVFRAGPPATILGAIATLRNELLVRRVGREQVPALDVFHSRVRDAVLASMDEETVRRGHRTLIALFERAALVDPMLLVHHYVGAGEPARAAELALAAAERSAEALAPNAAAAMYRKAIDLGASGAPLWQLQAALGTALVHAGHGGEGARWLDRASATLLASAPGDLEASRLRREAAEHYLRSGLHAEGLAALRDVLAAHQITYPRSAAAALASLLFHRARLAISERRDRILGRDRVTDEEHEILETYWSAGVGLSLFDGIRAADFNARHARFARKLADVGHMARAAASQGLILAWEGGRRKHARSVERLQLGKTLARASDNPNVMAHAMLMEAASAYMECRWRDAITLAADVEVLCTTRCQGAAWELANAHVMSSNSLACLGEARRLREHLPRVLRKASERDDQYLLVTGRLGHANTVWLMSDRPAEARRQAEDALAGPFPPGYAWQVYQGALAIGQIELYVDDPGAGWDHTERAAALMRSQHMMRFLPTRVEMLDLRARCALALAPRVGAARRRSLLRCVRRAARAIAAEDAPWVAPFATMLRAGLAAHAGRDARAARAYADAAVGFDRLGMRMHAWAARHRATALGAEAVPTDDWPALEGIVAPERIARVYAP